MLKTTLKWIFPLVILSAIACSKDDTPTTTSQKLSIGALIPISGSGASAGESAEVGLQKALQDVNAWFESIGHNITIDLHIEDTGTDPDQAIERYQKLKNDGIKLIIGPYSSTVLATLKPLADQDGILLLSPGSIAQSLAIAGDNVFRLLPSVDSQGEALAALLKEDSIKVLVPVARDDIWGSELLEATKAYFLDAGHAMESPLTYGPGTTDFTPLFSELESRLDDLSNAYEPNHIGVYLLSYGEGTELLSLAAPALDTTIRWYGTSGFAENRSVLENQAVAEFAESANLSCPSFGLDPGTQSKWQPFSDQFEATLGRKPEIFAFTTYDACWLAIEAMRQVGNDAPFDQLKAALTLQANNYLGLSGWTSLDENDDRAWAIYDFWGIQADASVPSWEVIARYNNASGNLTRY